MADRSRPVTRSVTKAVKGESDSSSPPPKKKPRISNVRKLDASQRLLTKGGLHQGDIDNGGSQCLCIAMSFLVKDEIPKCPPEVDAILHQGTALFKSIGLNQSGMTIQEFPTSVIIFNEPYTCSFYGPRSGLISQTSNDAESLTFCVSYALNDCFKETSSLILTLGNSPGASIALKKVNNSFVVFDSHSRDDTGMCIPEGRAVVLQFGSLNDLSKYVKDLAGSISADANMPFEVTATSIIERLPDNINCRQKKDQKKKLLPKSTKQSFLISKREAPYQVTTTETFKIKLRKVKHDMPQCSMCMLDSGYILIADSANPVLKQFNGDTYKIRYFLNLPTISESVCNINGTEAVVALSNQSILFVSTQNQLVATRTLSMDHYCLGVCVISDNIYITDGKKRNVFVYDMNGNIEKKVDGEYLFSWNRFMAKSDDGSAFYVTDMNSGLTKMSKNGEVIWKCSDISLKGALAVCTDGIGNIFVSATPESVWQISSNGQIIGEIILPGSKMITGLCFDKQKSKLFVARYYKCDEIYVYGLK